MRGPGGRVMAGARPSDGTGKPAAIGRPVAAIVVGAITIAWLLLTVIDVSANDGMASLMAMFGVPSLAAAVIIQIVVVNLSEKRHVPKPVLWWTIAVLPTGILAGFVVATLRDPEYFIGDEGPWMLIWVPIFIWLALLGGALVWFFFVFPIASLATLTGRIARKEVSAVSVVPALILLALGVLCVVGGLSIDSEGSGRMAWGAIIASFLGIPGAYEVLWEPGLWIVRGIIAAIVLVFAIPALSQRIRRTDPNQLIPTGRAER